LEAHAKPLKAFRPTYVDPEESFEQGEIPRPYSFTGDYIGYRICPRRYMLYRHLNFVPSRSQTMMFGNLVHRTIEDLHQWFIQQRKASLGASA
jgi:DNA helicase-2/ATP-dependent DNA helicase PcrA